MDKTGIKLGKTWSRGTNSRLPFGVNVDLNLSNISHNSLIGFASEHTIITIPDLEMQCISDSFLNFTVTDSAYACK